MSLIALGDVTWDVVARPDTLLLPGGDTTGRLELLPGGSAANLAVWAQRLGCPTTFVGKVGQDHFGDLALRGLQDEGLTVRAIRSAKHSTGVILALIDQRGQRAMLTGQGADWELLPAELPQDLFEGSKHSGQVSGHLHLTAWSLFRDPPRAAALQAAQRAHAAGYTLSLDPGSFQMIQQVGRENFLRWIAPLSIDIFFPNQDEARALSGQRSAQSALDWLREYFPQSLIVLKMDEEGAMIAGPQQEQVAIEATSDRLLDATGAGDAFGGSFLAHYLATGDALKAGHIAAQVGGWVVSHFGARPAPDQDLYARLLGLGVELRKGAEGARRVKTSKRNGTDV